MSQYPHLPGVNLELLDGNLRVDPVDSKRRVLVIGRSQTGPSNIVYNVRDTNLAANLFGPNSPLIQKMSEARLGGATEVSLYRIGGKAAKIKDIFGPGTFISTVEESTAAGDKYRIYIGPRPTKDGKACLIVFEGKEIVYSNVPGSDIDLGKISVSGFDENTTIKVGEPTKPVLFSKVILTAKNRTANFVGNGAEKEFFLPAATAVDTVEVTKLTVNAESKEKDTDFEVELVKEKGKHKIKFTGNAPEKGHEILVEFTVTPTGNEIGSQSFSGDGEKTKFTLAGSSKDDQIEITKATVSNVDKKATASVVASEDGLAKAVEFTEAPKLNSAVMVEYIVTRNKVNVDGAYEDGEDGIGSSWKGYYEMLYRGLVDLENVDALSVVTDAAIIDAPNIAYGDESKNRLEYVYVYEEDGEIKFDWSDSKVSYRKDGGQTKDPAEADLNGNGQPIVYREYSEVSFAHLLATFAHNMAENEKFCLVTIGTSLPVNTTTFEVSKWLGTLPTYDILGNIVTNGTGLLGLRRMVNRADVRRGFFKTTTGFVDGPPMTDSNGALIDIGKYLSVVPQVIQTPASSSAGTRSVVTNGAAVYAGLITTITPGNGTTNVRVPNIFIPLAVKKMKLNDLAGAGYVMFANKPDGVRVVSGELATSDDSDYDYISTSLAIASVIDTVRGIAEPFIGKGMTEATRAALDTAVESALTKLAEANVIIQFAHAVNMRTTINGKGIIDIPLTVVPSVELREVNVSIKLALDL